MFFPFSIKYSKRLENKISADKTDKATQFIKEFLANKSAEDIQINARQITFKASMFGPRWKTNIMVPIERGEFTLSDKDDYSIITYQFNMYRLFIIVTIMSIVFTIGSKEIFVGVMCFGWLGGMNWLVAIIRHRLMLVNIVNGLDQLSATNHA